MITTERIKTWLSSTSKSTDMTTGRILPILISFAIPVLIGNLFQQLYTMVDTAVVGRYVSANVLAGVGTTSPVTTLILGIMIGMSTGISVVIAQAVGKGDKSHTSRTIANGVVIMLALSVAVTVLGLLLSKPLFRAMNVPEEIMGDAMSYVSILFIGTIAKAAYNYESGVLRAFGNSFIPLVFLIVTSLMKGRSICASQVYPMSPWLFPKSISAS